MLIAGYPSEAELAYRAVVKEMGSAHSDDCPWGVALPGRTVACQKTRGHTGAHEGVDPYDHRGVQW